MLLALLVSYAAATASTEVCSNEELSAGFIAATNNTPHSPVQTDTAFMVDILNQEVRLVSP